MSSTQNDITINSRKFDGTVSRSWRCRHSETDGPRLLFIGEFEQEVIHPHLGTVKRGTISYEYYWLDRWYNIFRFDEPDGTLRNFYCNINMPPTFDGRALNYVDLDIDVLVWPGLSFEILDLDDFDENSVAFAYPDDVVANAKNGLTQVVGLIERRQFPFDSDTRSGSLP